MRSNKVKRPLSYMHVSIFKAFLKLIYLLPFPSANSTRGAGLVFTVNSLARALTVRGVAPLSLGPAIAHYRQAGALLTVSEVFDTRTHRFSDNSD
jgi:hypothetical protein